MSRIVFVITGSPQTGTGHAYRCLTLAESLVEHPMHFLCTPGSRLACEMIRARKFPVDLLDEQRPVRHILSHEPHIVINDMLDTEQSYVRALKDGGVLVVNFEDEGTGAREAHLVINALYHDNMGLPHVHHGEKYFNLRNEFVQAPPYTVRPAVRNVLLTFGGTDPSDLTNKSLAAVDEPCAARGIEIAIVTGPGYIHRDRLRQAVAAAKSKVSVVDKPTLMSQHMARADVCLTSAGRTVYELACLGVPTIALMQHERELRHAFVRASNGIWHLVGTEASVEEIRRQFEEIVDSHVARQIMHACMKRHDFSAGTRNVLKLIFDAYDRFKETR